MRLKMSLGNLDGILSLNMTSKEKDSFSASI